MVERILMTIRPLHPICKSANLHIVLLIFFLLSVIELRGQWISSTGIDAAVVSDLVALDSSFFICANNRGEMTGFQVPDLLKYILIRPSILHRYALTCPHP